MCVALNEINLSNVKELKQVKYEFGGREFKNYAVHCDTFEQFCVELNKRGGLEHVHSYDFLVLHFSLTQYHISKLRGDNLTLKLWKLIFTQESFLIEFEYIIKVEMCLCCSLSESFCLTTGTLAFRSNEIPSSSLNISDCYFFQADFSYLSKVYIVNTKFFSLEMNVLNLDAFIFKNNVVDKMRFMNMLDKEVTLPIEMSKSTFNDVLFYFTKKAERIVIRHSHLLECVTICSKDEIGKVAFENCYSTPDSVFDFAKSTVSERFFLGLNLVPAQLLLPDMAASADKILDLPQHIRVGATNFIPLKRLKTKDVEDFMPLSEYNIQKLEESCRICKNLERAYLLLKNAERNGEALSVLEAIWKEKHATAVLQRKVDGGSSAVKLRGAWEDLKHLFYYYVLGSFINLKKIFCTFIFFVACFSTVFACFPSMLKVGSDNKGLDITLQQLPIIDRIVDSIYFTVVTLTTLGYGDIQPLGWGKLVAAFLACIGLFLSGTILAVILRRYSR